MNPKSINPKDVAKKGIGSNEVDARGDKPIVYSGGGEGNGSDSSNDQHLLDPSEYKSLVNRIVNLQQRSRMGESLDSEEVELVSQEMEDVAGRIERQFNDAHRRATDMAIKIFLEKPRTPKELADLEEQVEVGINAIVQYREKRGEEPLSEEELKRKVYGSFIWTS